MLPLPPGTVDPIFLCQLALELKMSIKDIGERMSAHELAVTWPAYFKWRAMAQEREQEKQERESQRY